MHMRADEIAAWLRERVSAAGARGLVVGLSGGLDSAVVAGLCQMATPDLTIGVLLPCQSDPQDEADARLVAEHFRLATLRVDLEPAYEQLTADLRAGLTRLAADREPNSSASRGGLSSPGVEPAAMPADDLKARVPSANLKPRLRMSALYFVANSLNYLVAGTSNRCELTIGYFTKYGDGGADVLPIGHLLKSEVRALARDLGVPELIAEKPPSAGLRAGQSDEEDMGFTYADLERYLTRGPDGVAPALALRIERLIRQTDHKRAMPPIPGG
ncbi:MAG: NAD(+) synthase [Vicinamibacterales bacterium]